MAWLRAHVPLLLALGACGSAFAVAMGRLGADSAWVHPYTSDSAIAVLMANWDELTPFHLYYFGQDRLGAWPFLLLRLARAVTGFVWTPEAMSVVQRLVLFSGAFVVARLFRPGHLWAVVYCGLVLALPGRVTMFDFPQPYGWQLPLLFLAWLSLRRVQDVPSFALASLACFLVTWLSALSGPILLCFALAEALARKGLRARAATILPVLIGAGLEVAVRGTFQVYSKKTFGHSYRLELGVSLEGVGSALVDVLRTGTGLGAWALLLALVASAIAWVACFRGRGDENVRGMAGLGLAVLGQLALVASVSHFRENGFDPRYLVLAELMAALVLALALHLAVRVWPARLERALLPLTASLVSFAPLWMPPAKTRPDLALARAAAQTLAAAGPTGALLVSGYWEVYALAAVAPPGALLPLPADSQHQRTPFLKPLLKTAQHVWVGTGGFDPPAQVDLDAPHLFAHFTLLERKGPPVTIDGRTFGAFRAASALGLKPYPDKPCSSPLKVDPPAGAGRMLFWLRDATEVTARAGAQPLPTSRRAQVLTVPIAGEQAIELDFVATGACPILAATALR